MLLGDNRELAAACSQRRCGWTADSSLVGGHGRGKARWRIVCLYCAAVKMSSVTRASLRRVACFVYMAVDIE
jgi:hypothetical protein